MGFIVKVVIVSVFAFMVGVRNSIQSFDTSYCYRRKLVKMANIAHSLVSAMMLRLKKNDRCSLSEPLEIP